jgi:hypothetical protein
MAYGGDDDYDDTLFVLLLSFFFFFRFGSASISTCVEAGVVVPHAENDEEMGNTSQALALVPVPAPVLVPVLVLVHPVQAQVPAQVPVPNVLILADRGSNSGAGVSVGN